MGTVKNRVDEAYQQASQEIQDDNTLSQADKNAKLYELSREYAENLKVAASCSIPQHGGRD
jgi:hypothetical protein